MSGQVFIAPIDTPLGAAPGPGWKPLGLTASFDPWAGTHVDGDDELYTPPPSIEIPLGKVTVTHRFLIMLGWRPLNRTGKPLLHNGRKWRG